MNSFSKGRGAGSLSRRRFLSGAVASAGTLALADRLAMAQTIASGVAPITIDEIQGWGEVPGVVDIGDNENPYGPSPMAVRAIADQMLNVNRYDFSSVRLLETAIGELHGFDTPPPPTSRYAGSGYPVYVEGGSGFILNQVTLRYGIAGGAGEVMEAAPGYGGVSRYVSGYNRRFGSEIEVLRVPTTSDFKHDLDAMLAAITPRTSLIVITNPNNPSGTILPHADLARFVEAVPDNVMILIDEAYIHFVRESGYQDSVDLSQKHKNVLVCRTFSKIYGLAGLRVGYVVGDKDVIADLNFFGNNDGISNTSCYGAIAALEDRAFVRHVRRMTDNVKEYFYAELEKLGLSYIPSHSSFVLVNAGQDGEALFKRMAARNIMLSRLGMAGNPRMKNHIRFSMGTPDELQVAVSALKEELAAT
jgi:histidinol-phosphate aminotransferase